MYIHSTPSTPLLAEKYAEYAGDLSDVHKLHAAPPFFYKLLVGTISGNVGGLMETSFGDYRAPGDTLE